MDRTQMTLAIAAALFAAVLLGWGLRWIFALLNPPPPPPPTPDSEWAAYAKSCEAERDQAVAHRDELERQLTNRLTQTQAELDATMEGLRAARTEVHDLERRLSEAGAAAE